MRYLGRHLDIRRHSSDLVELLVPEVEVASEDDADLGRVFVDHQTEAELQLLQTLGRMVLKTKIFFLLNLCILSLLRIELHS